MTNQSPNDSQFYNINWVKPESQDPVLWPQAPDDTPKLNWTKDQLKQDLIRYEQTLVKERTKLSANKIKTSRVMQFEAEVKSYQLYVESNLMDVKVIAEMIMRPHFLKTFLSESPNNELEKLNQDGPVTSARRLRHRVIKAILEKKSEQDYQDIYFALPKILKYFWPNAQTLELAFQSVITTPGFKP
ncbi:MAG: hypothetical protein EXS67_03840 [Candidatus Margulisbacteria bacterium]|nr:hypothetical protein [Candidatus Margulisiibacteriota bacterium]